MTKKIVGEIKKIPKKILSLLLIFAIAYSYFMPITRAVAVSHGEGEHYITMDINNELGFTINSVTINDANWTTSQDEYHTNDEQYHIIINVSGNETTGDKVPDIQYGGNWNSYITMSSQTSEDSYTFVLDLNNSAHQDFLGLSIIDKNGDNYQGETGANFDGKAYVIWSCGDGTCYHYFDNIPGFPNGISTFYKNTDVLSDTDSTTPFDVDAEYKGWALKADFDRWCEKYKTVNNTETIDWASVDPSGLVGSPPNMSAWEQEAINEGACTKDNTPQDVFQHCVDDYVLNNTNQLPFIKLQPVGEPDANNAYVSYGDRNFKVVIYNEDYKGIKMANLNELSYYPSSWTNPFIMRDQFDISDTRAVDPTGLSSILLESTVIIEPINVNSFEIESIEALEVPEGAVTITENNGKYRIEFSSNFYDEVTFKVTDSNQDDSYFLIQRTTIDGWLRHDGDNLIITSDFYFDRTKEYTDFDIIASVYYNDRPFEVVNLTAMRGIDDGLGNITDDFEVDEQLLKHNPGKGLKKARFEYNLGEMEERNIKYIYFNVDYKGSTASNYAGAYVGSGKGVRANIYTGD